MNGPSACSPRGARTGPHRAKLSGLSNIPNSEARGGDTVGTDKVNGYNLSDEEIITPAPEPEDDGSDDEEE